jgi:hypothetical protein
MSLDLKDIEARLMALRKRYDELDAISVKKGFGPGPIFDGGAMAAMTTVDNEIKRLERLRENALCSDLVGQLPADSDTTVRRSALPPLPVNLPFAGEPPTNPFEGDDGLERVPEDEKARDDLCDSVMRYCVFEVQKSAELIDLGDLAHRPVQMTQGLFTGIIAAIAKAKFDTIFTGAFGRDRRKDLENSLRAEIETLLKRVQQLEARPSMKYAGTWNAECLYGEGVFVTDGGSMWHSNRANVGLRPGQADDWTLVVKRGRDGKDVRR